MIGFGNSIYSNCLSIMAEYYSIYLQPLELNDSQNNLLFYFKEDLVKENLKYLKKGEPISVLNGLDEREKEDVKQLFSAYGVKQDYYPDFSHLMECLNIEDHSVKKRSLKRVLKK